MRELEMFGEIKPMIYKDEIPVRSVLASGIYKRHRFAVVSYNTHPCAYVEHKLKDMKDCFYDRRLNGVNSVVHCGVTFEGKSRWDDTKCNYIGWDYNHLGDYNPSLPDFECRYGRKWDTEEVLQECYAAIDCLIEEEGKMTKIMTLRINETTDMYDYLIGQTLHGEYDGSEINYEVWNLDECPEDATIDRDLFSAEQFVETLEMGMWLAKLGCENIEVIYDENGND